MLFFSIRNKIDPDCRYSKKAFAYGPSTASLLSGFFPVISYTTAEPLMAGLSQRKCRFSAIISQVE